MSSMFTELIRRSKRITSDEFATTFGGITEDVVEMLNSDQARAILQQAREAMETAPPLPNGMARLRTVEFGRFEDAPELEQGLVAAVDGTFALPMQLYSAGQALSAGIGSLSYRRAFQDDMHYWSSRAFLADATDADDYIARQEQGLFGISQVAFMRYFEILHGLEIAEPIVFYDGPIIYEWLTTTHEGVNAYTQLFASGKQCIGVMKDLRANVVFAHYARAIRTAEIFILETLADHLDGSNASNRNHAEGGMRRYILPEFKDRIAPRILRGLFKPGKKAFGFEVHEDYLETMLRILAADCQLNAIGHEIPYLLNRVDEEVRRNFNPQLLQDRILAQMAAQSEEIFLAEAPERSFR